MKKIIGLSLVVITLMAIGVLFGKWMYYKPCKHHYINAIEDGRFIIVPQDSAEGKPTFTVIFEDDSTLEHMYAEEVMVGMNTGEWRYNDYLGEEGHTCIDSSHRRCDSKCECDGIMCIAAVN